MNKHQDMPRPEYLKSRFKPKGNNFPRPAYMLNKTLEKPVEKITKEKKK